MGKRSATNPFSILCLVLPGPPASAQNGGVEVRQAIQHDVSSPLRVIPPVPPKAGQRQMQPHQTHPQHISQPETLVQTSAGPLVAATAGLSFAGVGVGDGDYSFVSDAAPPDTNGAVGATQFVQWVNTSFAVFPKSGLGGGCETNIDGNVIAQYGKINRCVAVSTTSDATGTWNRYAFQQPDFNDYPKPGVWPDTYYMSMNMFVGGAFFVAPRSCALDGATMRAGAAATQVCFQLRTSFSSLLPPGLDGLTPPPANSTFIGPLNIPVAAYGEACGEGTCIPQSGTSPQLDSLGDRLMYRLAYRHFADGHVTNHSVATGRGNVEARWCELYDPNGSATLFHQRTFAPDSNYRWMGSIALDQVGDSALGYGVSRRVPTDSRAPRGIN